MSGVQRLSGTGALGTFNLVQNNIFVVSTTGAATAILPNGNEGDRIYILLAERAGDLVISGDFETGTLATLNAAKDALELMYIGGSLGWCTISNQGTVIFA